MGSQSQTVLILSQLEEGVAELQRTVQSFELATASVEQHIQELEQQELQKGQVDDLLLADLLQSLRESDAVAAQVHLSNASLDERLTQSEELLLREAPLASGALVLAGRYRIVQLLHTRPRVNLYLARSLITHDGKVRQQEQTFVALREIVLTGLSPELREQVEHAAFEEFAAPMLFGSQHFPGVGARPCVENGRHYLVMQLRPARGSVPAFAVPLSELLPGQGESPTWFSLSTALAWGVELCQLVARLHGSKNVPGELTPEMVMVSRDGAANWSPVLLAAWPPAPAYWSGDDRQKTYAQVEQIFPLPEVDDEPATEVMTDDPGMRPFAAPETFKGQRDERSDVYSLGALLYLLFTHSTPRSASARLRTVQESVRAQRSTARQGRKVNQPRARSGQTQEDSGLILPHSLCEDIPPLLEQILLRALALEPAQRFATALDLVEALESAHSQINTPMLRTRISRLRRVLEWLRKN